MRVYTEGKEYVRKALSMEELKNLYRNIAGRYDFQHALITARSDQTGRKILVENSLSDGNDVLDCGAGTGTTGIMAAKKIGLNGRVTMFDLSESMLAMARKKVVKEGLQDRVTFKTGDIIHLPFNNDSFDVVLSSYSLCPLYDPERGALEMYRVTRPGGNIAVVHSTEPHNPIARWLSDQIENWAWHFPMLSMGCRSVNVLPVLIRAGGKIILSKNIGIPFWPFFVFIVKKTAN